MKTLSNRLGHVLILSALFFSFFSLHAQQPGTSDDTFNPLDKGNGAGDGVSHVYCILTQPDGKHIIAGGFTAYNNTGRGSIARVNSDGTLDGTFSGPGANNSVRSIALQDDGKILVGGIFSTYAGVARKALARANSDGTLDASFKVGTGFNGNVEAIAIQDDNKILVGGTFTTYNDTTVNYLVRLNEDGTIDLTFESAANAAVYAIAVEADNKILIGGDFTNYLASGFNRIARLKTDGLPDETFVNSGTGASGTVKRILIRSDNKIMIGGSFISYNSVSRFDLALLGTDGALDTSFDPSSSLNNTLYDMVLQDDGKLIAAGDFTSYRGNAATRIVRINTDGTIDNTFDIGTGANSIARALAVQPDGTIMLGGSFSTYNSVTRPGFVRLSATGSIDLDFNPLYGANADVKTSVATLDGGVIIAGNFTAYNNGTRNRIAKIDKDGVVDPDFNATANGNINVVIQQADGKLLLGGNFTSINSVARSRIARLHADGTLDTDFDPGTGANDDVLALALQEDGKILVGGEFTAFNGDANVKYLTRLNENGSADPAFTPGTGPDNKIQAIAMQGEKILIGGWPLNYNGTAIRRMARLNSDGSLDETFTTGTGFDQDVRVIVLQGEKILVGGTFNSYNGTAIQALVRLHPDGALDSFAPGITGSVYTISFQPNGRIIIGGGFSRFFGAKAWVQIARLNVNGSMDESFFSGSGLANDILTTTILPDGDIIIGGSFRSYKSVGRNRVAKIKGGKATPVISWPNPAAITYGTVLGNTQLNASTTIAGTFEYDPAAGTKLNAGADQTLSVTFTPTDAEGYHVVGKQALITVNKASQTITFNALAPRALGDPAFELTATSSSGLPVTFQSGNTAVATIDGNLVTIAGAGTAVITASQAGDDNYHAASDVEQSLVVKYNQTIAFEEPGDKVYGDEPFELLATASSGLDVEFSSGNEDVAVVSGNTVTIVGAGQTIISAIQAGDTEYFPAATVEYAMTVDKANQNLTFDPIHTRTYHSGSFLLVASSDTGQPITFSSSESDVATIDGDLVTITGVGESIITAIQAGNANYHADTVSRTLVITRSPQIITFPEPQPPFIFKESEPITLEASSTSSLPVSYESTDTDIAVIDGNTLTFTGAGEVTIYASQAGNEFYEPAEVTSISLTVDKAFQYIDRYDEPGIKTFGDAPFNLVATASSGLSVSFTSDNTDVAVIEGNVVTIVGAGDAKITASQVGDDDYEAADGVAKWLIVDKASQTISFDPLDARAVNAPSFDLQATASSGLPVSYTSSNPVVATVQGSTVTLLAAGTTTITASQDGNQNYNYAEPVQRVLVVDRATQTITFDPIGEKTYGDDVFSLIASTTSGLPVEFASSNADVARIEGNTVTIIGAGSATITATQTGNETYHPADDVTQQLVINKADQDISFEPLSPVSLSEGTFILTASATSGLPVTYSSSNTAVATVNGNQVTLISSGTTTITASQEGNGNFNAAQSVASDLVVEKISQEITFPVIASKHVGEAPFDPGATASSGLPVSYTSSEPLVATISGGIVTIHGSGTTTITATQSGNDEYHPAEPVSRELEVLVITDAESPARLSIRLYPNPVDDKLTCVVGGENAAQAKVKILNTLGVAIPVSAERHGDVIVISTEGISSGIYLLEIQANGRGVSERIYKK